MAQKLSFSMESILNGNFSTNCCSEHNSTEQRKHSCTVYEKRARVVSSSDQSTPPSSPTSTTSSAPSPPDQYEPTSRDETNVDYGTKSSKKGRMRFTPKQIQTLEQRFQEQHYLLPADRKILALALRMSERQVKTWFQNKRAQCKRSRPQAFHPFLSSGYAASYNVPYPPYHVVNSSPVSLLPVDHKPLVVMTQSPSLALSPSPFQFTPYIPCQRITGTD